MEEISDIYSVRLERDELHRWIGGGLPKGSLVLIEGGLGTGKSILSQRLAFGFLSNEISCAYLSTEMPIKDFIKQMITLNYDVTSHLLGGDLFYASSFLTMSDAMRKRDPLMAILRNEHILGMDAILLDSFDPLIYGVGRDQETVLQLTTAIKKLGKAEKVLIITADPERSDPALMASLRAVADVSIQLDARQMASSLKRRMTIARFLRPGGRYTNMIGFRVEPGIGFVIEISMVA